MNHQKINIELLVLSDYGAKEKIISRNTSAIEIKNTMASINWDLFHQVILSRSEKNWIEVGGNLNEDGLSCVYEENDEVFVINNPPTSVKQMTEILISYFNDDNKFKDNYKFTGDKEESINKKLSDEKFEAWKKDFEIQAKKDKVNDCRKILIAFLLLLSFCAIGYYWYIGELKFLGQKTEVTKAEIIKTQMHHIGRGYYMQTVTYEFEYNNNKYKGTFEAGKRFGIQEVGRFIRVKFSISNPKRSLVIGFY